VRTTLLITKVKAPVDRFGYGELTQRLVANGAVSVKACSLIRWLDGRLAQVSGGASNSCHHSGERAQHLDEIHI